MNTIRVSRNAARRLGMIISAMLLMLLGLLPLSAAQITITVKGTANGGRDMFHVFGKSIAGGTPYTLVFTFDDAKGRAARGGPCSDAGTGIVGRGQNSPGIAVLTMSGKSYEFGHRPDARSQTWRSVETVCSRSEIGISIEEGPEQLPWGVHIKIRANPGKGSLTQDKDWRSSISLSDFDARNGDNDFAIRQPFNYNAETLSYLSVDTLTVKGKSWGWW